MNKPMTLREMLVAPDEQNTTVAWEGGSAKSTEDFRTRARAWAKRLEDCPGQQCALVQRNGFEFLCSLFGAWLAGKTVWLPSDTLPATMGRLASVVNTFLGEFPADVATLLPDTSTSSAGGLIPISKAALVLYTSGSTGEPEAISKTFEQLDTEIQALNALWGDQVGTALVLSTVPHQHLYGLLFKLLWPLMRGAPFVSERMDYPEETIARLAPRPGVWVTSPALLKRLPESDDWSNVASHLVAAFSSGGPLPLSAARHVARLVGRGVIEVYGSTETGGIAHRVQTAAATRWRTFPGVTVSQHSESGRLAVLSPWVPAPEAWVTDDRGEVFPDGEFTLLGRADRIVKVEEKRVSLSALEQVLVQTPWVRAARLVQIASGRLGAVVVPKAEGWTILKRGDSKLLIGYLREALGSHAERVVLPRRWRFVERFPENALGKVSNAVLLSQFHCESQSGMPIVCEETVEFRKVNLKLLVEPDLPWFDGHFPDAPILPGVVQVHWAIAMGRKYFELPKNFVGVEQAKFQKVIVPGMELLLVLEHLPGRNAVSFRYTSVGCAHGSGRVVFKD